MSERRYWWTAFVAIGSLAVLWALSTPVLLNSDEPAHTLKAVAVARGELQTGSRYEGTVYRIPQTAVEVPEGYGELSAFAACYVAGRSALPPTAEGAADPCRPPPRGSLTTLKTYVGGYPPTYYALVGWPSHLFSPVRAFYAMRTISALLGAALLASAVTSAARLPGARLLVPAAALGVTPVAIGLAGSLNPNGLEVAAAAAGLTSAIALLVEPRPVNSRLIVRCAIALALLSSTRSLGPLFVAGIVGTALLVAARRDRLVALWADRRVRAAGAAVVAVCAVSAVFIASVGAKVMTTPAPVGLEPGESPSLEMLKHLPDFQLDAVGAVGLIGFRLTQSPRGLALAWLGAVLVLLAGALVLGRWRDRWAAVLLLGAVAALPAVAQLTYDEGFILWTGRYTLPLAVGLPVVGAWAVVRSGRVRVRILAVAGAAIAVGTAATHASTLYRWQSDVAALGRDVSWQPPLSTGALHLATIVTGLVYLAFLLTVVAGRLRLAEPVPAGVGGGT